MVAKRPVDYEGGRDVVSFVTLLLTDAPKRVRPELQSPTGHHRVWPSCSGDCPASRDQHCIDHQGGSKG